MLGETRLPNFHTIRIFGANSRWKEKTYPEYRTERALQMVVVGSINR